MGHECHAEACTRQVPPRMFACRSHWGMVPTWLQKALWAVYVPGQEVSKKFTSKYLMVQIRCRIAIARGEGRDVAELETKLYRLLCGTFPLALGFGQASSLDLFDELLREGVSKGTLQP